MKVKTIPCSRGSKSKSRYHISSAPFVSFSPSMLFLLFSFHFLRRFCKERRKFEYGITVKLCYTEAHMTCTTCVQIFVQYLKFAKKTINPKKKLIKLTFWHRCLIWNARNVNERDRQSMPEWNFLKDHASSHECWINVRTNERTSQRILTFVIYFSETFWTVNSFSSPQMEWQSLKTSTATFFDNLAFWKRN